MYVLWAIPSAKKIRLFSKKVRWGSENQTSPVFQWSIIAGTGRRITGLLKNWINFSGFFNVSARLDCFKQNKYVLLCIKRSRLAEKLSLVFNGQMVC
jgi:hypothetical protein